ncbi:tRNA cyclic N6-threonylcarbamoyladenosine(37) synthase TcdA [Pseudoduganella albidiflava]|uniref:tRNA cyclic N6-threonylcarbamoyladenosine(37) synthase TcdA n=1 Tax=Pseudoduganella albidiflava TaxID=321983 RepID=A0A411WS57_9BURK|nr:tRNA cyclic N6-threonylcarbamoyladenosine(37) synthase TcdA [Pseudoduganella albidiflava]QBH99602.1 tRNA cyclic N6-threonylcarbamoyladenosine(37) synthase TcdA [Pseudoduganella albidiflava]GGY46104.1 tRNA threonylcarbamoyladenosine dehydratase [Pseudoduganella albidiflava]
MNDIIPSSPGPGVHISDENIIDEHDVDFDRRFGGIARLYGAAALERYRAAHVCVIGVGGVGSWIVEALARSAIGRLTLIDLDNVAESNINRQIQALTGTVGMAKVTALRQRIAQINPYCQVTEIEDFVTPDNLEEMIGGHDYDYVIDAMDNTQAKTALVHYCRTRGIRLIMIGSAGGQTDPTKIEVRDLARTEQEPLLKKVRRRLRSQFHYPPNGKNKLGVDAVFSMEPLKFPETGDVCEIDPDDAPPAKAGLTGINCAGFGSAMVVTATFGMVAAGHVLRKLAEEEAPADLPVGQPA